MPKVNHLIESGAEKSSVTIRTSLNFSQVFHAHILISGDFIVNFRRNPSVHAPSRAFAGADQILEAQVAETLGAERHERTEERAGYRHHMSPAHALHPRWAGHVAGAADAGGRFSTEIFKRYQRSEQAFVLALMEMVAGRVDTQGLGDHRGTVRASFRNRRSARCVQGWTRVRAFNERRLEGATYPFVLVDALFVKSREGDRVVHAPRWWYRASAATAIARFSA